MVVLCFIVVFGFLILMYGKVCVLYFLLISSELYWV